MNLVAQASYILAIVLFISETTFAEGLSKDPCENTVIPKEVLQLVTDRFPSWHVLRFSDLYPDRQEDWLRSQYREQCPGIAAGHFETKASLSHAMLLIPNDKTKNSFRLVVVHSKHGRLDLKVLIDAPCHNCRWHDEVVYRLPPGKYEDFYQEKTIVLTNEGFQWETSKGAWLFYWKKGQYHKIITSD